MEIKNITREDIIEELRKSGHNPIKSKQLEDAIKAMIGRQCRIYEDEYQ